MDANLELLSPCGNFESLISAINGGANAVYLGVNDFNARKKADNFTTETLTDAVRLAHLNGVKVYLTVNTLISDQEVPAFLSVIASALKSGVDAFIVQDFGMATLLKNTFNGITLHASTQMGIHNLQGALFLEKLGFTRVVLSRETKLEDIIAIKNGTNLEIEYFVHGALCVGFSGNCYISAVKTGKSGNRGECKQLCRLKYNSQNKNGYLISPNDLCLITKLNDLIKAGVTSFKIEGRLKRPSYVYATAMAYRKALDGASEKEIAQNIDLLSKIFSRGKFNDNAYLYDNDGIIDATNKSHTGEFIGEVVKVSPFKNLFAVTIKSSVPIKTGDGLKLLSQEETSIGVGNVDYKNGLYTVYTTNPKIKTKSKVYRLLDSELENSLLSNEHKIPISANFNAYEDIATLTLTCGDISVTATTDCQTAKSAPIDKNFVLGQMKFGDTPFTMVNFDATVKSVFMPKSKINELRRSAVTLLEDALLQKNKSAFLTANPNFTGSFTVPKATPYAYPTESIFVVNEYSKAQISNGKIVFFPTEYTIKTVNALVENFRSFYDNGNAYLNLPPIATGKDIAVINDVLKAHKNLNIVANNYYALTYTDRKIIAGAFMNCYNTFTANALLSAGAELVLPSVETHPNFYGGEFTLMTFTHCPYKVSANSSCSNCKANTTLTYTGDDNSAHNIRRYKMAYCYFELKSATPLSNKTAVLRDARLYK